MESTLAGGVISFMVEKVKDYALSFISTKFVQQQELEDDICKISEMLESIRAALQDAEEKQVKTHVELNWLGKLKDVVYDLEDLLDECAVGGLAEDDGEQPTIITIRRWVRPVLDLLPGGTAAFRRDVAQRIKFIKGTLDEINQQKDMSLPPGGSSTLIPSQQPQAMRQETTSLLKRDQPIVGREEVKAKIIEELLKLTKESESLSSPSSLGGGGSPSKPKICLIAIFGMGGIGKTTLAQAIYNDGDVGKEFSMRRWVHVGENFDAKRLIKEIIGPSSNAENLGDLQDRLIDKIKERRFLIVLDDAWCDNSEMWEDLWKALSYGGKGGAVVVTTRNQAVGMAIPHESEYSEHFLVGLSDKECMDIFKRRAFKGQKLEKYCHLEGLCRQIVPKLKGVPLAATMMGGYLSRYLDNVRKWIDAANDDEWPQIEEGDLVDRVIGLSYRHLPPHFKLCFAYSCMLPKGEKFSKETVVWMWIAHGYIRPRGNELMEHTGNDYFDELQQRSFFQQSWLGGYYEMHDLVHDFSQKLFPEGSKMITGGMDSMSSLSKQVRHLSIYGDEEESSNLEGLNRFRKLRTLCLRGYGVVPRLDVIAEFKYLRVLEISSEITEFPDSVGQLKLLRYLDIGSTRITTLPELVCCLVNLQVLIVPWDCTLPEGISKLVGLRQIIMGDNRTSSFKDIGKLTCLQGLDSFHVGKESGYRIEELRNLDHLHGELSIHGLENVENKEEAELANLEKKLFLNKLVLGWACEGEKRQGYEQAEIDREGQVLEGRRGYEEAQIDREGQVLEGLVPPRHLTSLKIRNHLGAGPPNWMKEQHHLLLSGLVRLVFDGCSNWEGLPTLGQLPSLTKLYISGASKVKKVGLEFYGIVLNNSGRENKRFFPSLERLSFENMNEWEEWEMPLLMDEDGGGPVFPSLQHLEIVGCPKLIALTDLRIYKSHQQARLEEGEDGSGKLFPSLQQLSILLCPKLRSLSPILRHLTALNRLSINHCDQLESLVNEDGRGPVLPSLEGLLIDLCHKLGSLSPILRHVTALKKLTIRSCDQLQSLLEEDVSGRVLPSLEELSISVCPKLGSLSPMLRHVTALKELTILSCNRLESLLEEDGRGRVLPSLSRLKIKSCPKLASLIPPPFIYSLKSMDIARCPSLMEKTTISIEGMRSKRRRTFPHPSSSSSHGRDHQQQQDHKDLEVDWASSSSWQLERLSTDNRRLLNWILQHKLESLVGLSIEECHELLGFTEEEEEGWKHLLSLQKLAVDNCVKIQSLPSTMHNLCSLEIVWLTRCPEIRCLPEGGLPTSLERLWISQCPLLEERCREGGLDNHKIPRLTDVTLGDG